MKERDTHSDRERGEILPPSKSPHKAPWRKGTPLKVNTDSGGEEENGRPQLVTGVIYAPTSPSPSLSVSTTVTSWVVSWSGELEVAKSCYVKGRGRVEYINTYHQS